jgi:hypothetical protein
MPLSLQEVAQEFSLSEETLTKESIRAYLVEQLRIFDAERRARCAKFGVKTLAAMEELVQRGTVPEESLLEDFQHVDYLTTRVERIKQMLEEL